MAAQGKVTFVNCQKKLVDIIHLELSDGKEKIHSAHLCTFRAVNIREEIINSNEPRFCNFHAFVVVLILKYIPVSHLSQTWDIKQKKAMLEHLLHSANQIQPGMLHWAQMHSFFDHMDSVVVAAECTR